MANAGPWTLELPYTRPPLGLNDRLHHMAKYRLTKQLRGDAHTLALAAKLPKGLARVGITLHWQATTRRGRDSDNPTLTLKPLIDGLRDYGLIADDDSEHVTSGCVIEALGPRARVWLTIHDLTERVVA